MPSRDPHHGAHHETLLKGEKYLGEHFQVEGGPGTVVTGRMEAE
jgi:hypothetical protein